MGSTFSETPLTPLAQTASPSDQFTIFKKGLSQAPAPVWNELGYIFAGLAVLLAAVLLYNRLTRRRRRLKTWSEETNPAAINGALERAANHWAEYQLEIFNPNYPEIYRGRFLSVESNGRLLLSLPRFQNVELDFAGEPAQVTLTFRDRPGRPLEQYQFRTQTVGRAYFQDLNLREPAVAVSAPLVLITAERRQFRRLELSGPPTLPAIFFGLPSKRRPHLDKQAPLAEARILNLSLKGLKAAGKIKPGLKGRLLAGQKIMLAFILPLDGLELELQDTKLFVQAKILDLDYGLPGPAGGQNHYWRLVISGRYRPLTNELGHEFQAYNPVAFQSLAHWLNACERRLIRKERGTEARPNQGQTF